MRRLGIVAAALSAAVLLGACGGSDGGDGGSTSPATGGGGHEGTVTITTKDNVFEPNAIQGTAGQAMTVEIVNQGQAAHTFTITSLDVDVTIEVGGTETASFTLPDAGPVEFMCKFHGALGMKGTIVVG